MTTTPAWAPPTALSLQDVSLAYPHPSGAVVALDHVSLDVTPGRWLAIMGPSGSGKSTLLHASAGLERVDTGRVALAGVDITGLDDDALTILRRDRIGFVFQGFNLIESLSAAENVALPQRLAGREPAPTDVREALESVGLATRADHRPRELSGGQRQRVALARAMIVRPAVLFADEPTGALDSTAAQAVLDQMRDMADRGQTIVMVTHDAAAAARADETVLLRDGRIVDRLVRPSAADVADRLLRLEA